MYYKLNNYMLIPGSNMHDSSLAGMIPLSLLNKIWDSLLLLKLTHHAGNVDTACGKSHNCFLFKTACVSRIYKLYMTALKCL